MTKVNVFDQTLKIIARNYASTFLQIAFPNTPIRLIGTIENVEIALPVRPVDFVHRVEHESQAYILHIEFQLKHHVDFPQRMCIYHGALTEVIIQPPTRGCSRRLYPIVKMGVGGSYEPPTPIFRTFPLSRGSLLIGE